MSPNYYGLTSNYPHAIPQPTGMSEHDTHWTAKAAWMRAVGATDAAWSTEGNLVHVKLGPAPAPAAEDDDREDPAKQLSPQERERRDRLARRSLAERASGGPVPRLDVDLG